MDRKPLGGPPFRPNITDPSRLSSLRKKNPNLTMGGVQKPTFQPAIPVRKKPETKEEPLDSALPEITEMFKPDPVLTSLPFLKDLKKAQPKGPAKTSTSLGGPPGRELGKAKKPQKTLPPSEIDPFNKNHPVTLPFFDPYRRTEVKVSEDLQIQTPASTFAKPSPASSSGDKDTHFSPLDFFESEYEGDQMIVMQLPTQLPFSPPPPVVAKPAEQPKAGGSSTTTTTSTTSQTISKDNEGEFRNNMKDIKPGRMGKIVVYKSGKMKFQMGDVQFDVTPGYRTNFLQEIAILSDEEIYHLGETSKKLIVSPDIQDIHTHTSNSNGPS